MKDSGGSTTILVSELADKFAVAGSGSGEKIVEANPNDTLPDAWANLI